MEEAPCWVAANISAVRPTVDVNENLKQKIKRRDLSLGLDFDSTAGSYSMSPKPDAQRIFVVIVCFVTRFISPGGSHSLKMLCLKLKYYIS